MLTQTLFGRRVELVLFDDKGRRLRIRDALRFDPSGKPPELRSEHIESCIVAAEQSGQWGSTPRRPLLDGGSWIIEVPE